MSETPLLVSWSSFYVMTGSSAAALTGLMFVVITLTTGRETASSRDGISTFSTPTVMHFAAVLLVSAIFSAPWHSLLYAGILVACIGLYGVAYVSWIAYRTRGLTVYTADPDDWLWYTILPFVAYGAILGGALGAEVVAQKALFVVGLGVVFLLFIGVRNAWDVVTYLAISGPPSS